MGIAPGSKPDAISDKVATAYHELKDGINNGSVENAMDHINNIMHDLSPKDWGRFSANLSRKINTTANMLPELSILATENSLSGKLENGTITDSDVNARITADQGATVQNQNKSSFEEGLLQSFVQNEYNTAKGESGGWLSSSVSMDDLNKDLADKKSTTDALAQLVKNNYAGFTELADKEDGVITRESIQAALKLDKTRADDQLPPILDGATRDVANKLLNDGGLFNRLGQSSAAESITAQDLNTEMRNEHANMVQFQKADQAPAKGATDSATTKGTTDKHTDKHQPGKPGDGQPHQPSSEGQQPGSSTHGKSHAHATESNGEAHPHKETKLHHLTEEKQYTVQRGDSLWGIARRLFDRGNPSPSMKDIHDLIIKIAEKNGIDNPNYIRDGQVLNLNV